jgi:hypothetical protein
MMYFLISLGFYSLPSDISSLFISSLSGDAGNEFLGVLINFLISSFLQQLILMAPNMIRATMGEAARHPTRKIITNNSSYYVVNHSFSALQ